MHCQNSRQGLVKLQSSSVPQAGLSVGDMAVLADVQGLTQGVRAALVSVAEIWCS